MRRRLLLPVLAASLAIAAGCGGGGGGSGGATSETPTPTITRAPVALTVLDGATATFSVQASGGGTLRYQWTRDGADIAGGTSDSLSFPARYADDGLRIAVIVANDGGSVTSAPVLLTVTPILPTITTPPASLTVNAGAAATFSVQVSAGTVPISYQWTRNGTAIQGAVSPSYSLDPTATQDDGARFVVEISNPAGTVQSAEATLTVSGASQGSAWRSIDIGAFHASVVRSDGAVFSWGESRRLGTSGYPATPGTIVPMVDAQGQALRGVLAVAVGFRHSLALRSDGTALAWGEGGSGVLGNGSTGDSLTPVVVETAAGQPLSNVTAIAAAGEMSLALRSDGSVWAWGNNSAGQLGDGSTVTQRTRPVQVLIATGQPLDAVVAIAAGGSHALALRSDGTVWAWGWNAQGQLGRGVVGAFNPVDINERFAKPVEESPGVSLSSITGIAAGSYNSIATRANGTAFIWGATTQLQLADGQALSRSRPASLRDGSGNLEVLVAKAAAGVARSMFLMRNGTILNVGPVSATPEVVLDDTGRAFADVADLATEDGNFIVRRIDGSLWAWGGNQYGQSGQATGISYTTPQRVFVPPL